MNKRLWQSTFLITVSGVALSVNVTCPVRAQNAITAPPTSATSNADERAATREAASTASKSARPSATPDSQGQNDIVVTGVTDSSRKLDTTFTINTLSQAQIQQLAPISTAALLNNIPGFFAEGSTAGERSNNVTVRGLPSSGYRYAPQLVDGMPVFQDSDVPFANSDVFFSTDLMTDRVEAIKGGPGGALYSNGLGGVVNYITKTGGDKFAGGYKLELADYGFVRNDLFVSGPITDTLHFAVGGFYRTSHGLRDTGYTADRGGQVRGNLTYRSDDGRTNVGLYATFLNDRSAVFNNLPIEVPGFSAPGTVDDPIRIKSGSVKPIGINFRDGTLLSPSNRYLTQVGDNGEVKTIDLADGIHPVFTTLAATLSHEFDSGWRVDFKANYVDGKSGFNALFAGNDAAPAASFLNDRYIGDFLQPAFDANFQAASGTPLNSSAYNRNILATYFNALDNAAFQNQYINPLNASGFANFDALRAQYGNTQTIAGPGGRIAAFNVRDGQPIAAGSNLSFEIPWVIRSKLKSATQDLRIQKTFELFGEHTLTFGGYHADASDDYNFQASLTISTLASPTELVDLYLVNASGAKVAPLSLRGSFIPGFYGNAVSADSENFAGYVLDHWEAFDHKLKIDAGFRWEREKLNVRFQNRNCCTINFPGNATTGNRAFTQNQSLGDPQFLNDHYSAHGWTIGANYEVARQIAIYGLASRSFRLPSMNDGIAFAQSAPLADPVERITQFEGGARFQSRYLDMSAAGFYNKFTPRTLINTYQDINSPLCTAGGTVATTSTITLCPRVNQPYSFGTTNYGTEIQATLRPFIPGFEVGVDVTLQNPRVKGSTFTIVNQVGTTYQLATVTQDGRREARQSVTRIFIRPRWDLKPLLNVPVKLYASYEHESARYSTSQDINVTVYPSYYILDAGALWDVTNRLSLQVHVANLTNQLSFTEGDPLFFDLKAPDGVGNRGVARPLFGRTARLMLNYRF
ncbi:TonB-dependent receptor [Sphingomonas sp. AP4-R1]|uniref:TonB-dependent receptor n=1 Tax=Sphingomonas sp. AP4-R1 TaxID=2735134 RepID=UPI001493C5E9|nr:TonB-dependent receptor [Sphingomonas sp. AP4-R1]QJU60272.1 TonB-dependent receptor [Sphingomonas sp. AP4-R1]